MTTFYNENDPKAAAWLRSLIEAGLISPGVVDERSITDLGACDLDGYDRVHLFAGIGGWDYALQLAGWPENMPVWTGSCPCQPFSAAGKRKGTSDERHLWPEMRRLISECRPAVVFGEQVASKDGRQWLAGVRAEMEGLGYAVGAADLCAASVGAPHIRQRLFWVAESSCQQSHRSRGARGGWMQPADGGADGRVGIAESLGDGAVQVARGDRESQKERRERQPGGSSASHWSDHELIACQDGKSRRIEPGLKPLAHGIQDRVGLLRGYGNAIVPQVAAEFIRAYVEAKETLATAARNTKG
jgi:DNA (cytosine-5)-methyltransferase 1